MLLADRKDQLRAWCEAIERHLLRERLALHPRKKTLYRTCEGQDILGYRVFPQSIRLSRGSGYQFRRRLKRLADAYGAGRIGHDTIQTCVAGWLGHAQQADTEGLRKTIFRDIYFRRERPSR